MNAAGAMRTGRHGFGMPGDSAGASVYESLFVDCSARGAWR